MIEFTIETDKGVKKRLRAASSWSELTLDQLIQIELLEEGQGVLEMFCILTGLNLTVLENSKDEKLERAVWEVVSFLGSQPDYKGLAVPTVVQAGLKYYKVPLKFTDLTIGQKIVIGQRVRTPEDTIRQIPFVIAVIMQPIIDEGPFENKRIPELEEQFKTMNGLQAYALARFFFASSKILKRYGLSVSPKSQSLLTRRRTLSPNWLITKDSNPLAT